MFAFSHYYYCNWFFGVLKYIMSLFVLNTKKERKKRFMHELGVLCHAVKTVSEIAEKNKIKCIKFMTLEVGESSSFVPAFLEKLFPVATENFPLLKNAQLRIRMAPGNGLIIKEIGY